MRCDVLQPYRLMRTRATGHVLRKRLWYPPEQRGVTGCSNKGPITWAEEPRQPQVYEAGPGVPVGRGCTRQLKGYQARAGIPAGPSHLLAPQWQGTLSSSASMGNL